MTVCVVCNQDFDPAVLLDSPEVQMGILLARERFADEGRVCGCCLASRGRLAVMYDSEFRR